MGRSHPVKGAPRPHAAPRTGAPRTRPAGGGGFSAPAPPPAGRAREETGWGLCRGTGRAGSRKGLGATARHPRALTCAGRLGRLRPAPPLRCAAAAAARSARRYARLGPGPGPRAPHASPPAGAAPQMRLREEEPAAPAPRERRGGGGGRGDARGGGGRAAAPKTRRGSGRGPGAAGGERGPRGSRRLTPTHAPATRGQREGLRSCGRPVASQKSAWKSVAGGPERVGY